MMIDRLSYHVGRVPRSRRGLALFVVVTVAIVGCHRATATAAPGTGAAQALSANRMPAGVTPQMIALGDSLFNNGSCQRCHGKGGVGATNAPNLTDSQWLQISGSYDEIVKTITDGVPRAAIKDSTHRFQMNPRGGPMQLDDAKVRAVAAYVYSLSHK
jgi:mono/diheme cytochrome c family protein